MTGPVPPSGVAPACCGPTKVSGPGGTSGLTRSRVPARITTSRGRPAVASLGTSTTSTAARAATAAGASSPTPRTPASTSPTAWTQPAPLLWATSHHARSTPAQLTSGTTGRTGRTTRCLRAASPIGLPRPTRPVTAAGAGVVSSRARTTATPCSTPSSVRSRWARHATATAFTSSGVTKVLVDNTAWAWAARMSQIAARGLAPRRTPGAPRLARHNATAYSATLDATSTDSVARWAPSHSWVLHTGRSSPRANLPPPCWTSRASVSASG